MPELITVATQVVAFVGLVSVAGLLATALVRLVARDGYGHRPAPRGVEEWTAHGLPSRPYGT
jgi:hypothetical protein